MLFLIILSQQSFEKAKYWVTELRGAGAARSDVIIAFVGNKCDMADERQVSTQVRLFFSFSTRIKYFCFEFSCFSSDM